MLLRLPAQSDAQRTFAGSSALCCDKVPSAARLSCARGLDIDSSELIIMSLTRLLVVCNLVLGARALRPAALARPVSLTASVASAATLWSEASVAATGCGPALLPDALERLSYVAVLGYAGASGFSRIAFGESAHAWLVGEPQPRAARWAERLSLACVAGAFLALACQVAHGQQMDALSGIDELYCAALR